MLDLPTPRSDQLAIIQHPARIKVLSMGRRWGKTVLGSIVVGNVLRQHGRVAWIAPTYKNARPLWRSMVQITAPAVKQKLMRVNKADATIQTNHGGELALYSGDNIDTIRGEGFHLVVIDEAARIPEDAWTDAIMPTLSDFEGEAVLISTPKGLNWFHTEYQRAMGDGVHAMAWQAPSADNPIPSIQRAVKLAEQRVPEFTFQQEWLAQFVKDGAGVFRRVREAATAEPQEGAIAGHDYIMSADWALSADYTVLTVFDLNERAIVHVDRFNQVDYTIQANRLKALAQRFRPVRIIAESNAMGMPIIHQLANDGLPMDAFNTTSATKDAAIRDLAIAFETADIRIIPDETLINELMAYQVLRTSQTGVPVYGAPSGMHDDCVMSAAIGWSRLAQPASIFL